MAADGQSVEFVDIKNMKQAAVLDAYGFTMTKARAEAAGEQVRVIFTYIVNPEQRPAFDRICDLCSAGYQLPLIMSKAQITQITESDDGDVLMANLPTLGDYERCFKGVRRIIDDFSDKADETPDKEADNGI